LKRSVILFTLLFALVASTAGFGAVLWDKMQRDPWAYDSETVEDYGVYSDFDYPGAGTFELTATTPVVGVEWQGHYYDWSVIDPDHWIIQIWNQDPASAAPLGYPGGVQPIFTQAVDAPAQVPIRMMYQYTEQRYYANLSPAFTPPAPGVYWIQITAQDYWFYMQLASRFSTDLIPPSPPTQAYASGFGYGEPWGTKQYYYWLEPYSISGDFWCPSNTVPNVPAVNWYPCLPMLKLDSGQVSAPPVYTVTGTVTDGSSPVAGASVGLCTRPQATAQPEFYGYTDSSGRFEIKAVGIGPTCYVAAWAPNRVPTPDTAVNITTNPDVTLTFDKYAGMNVALKRPVWASSLWEGYDEPYAVDGDFNTEYASDTGLNPANPVDFIVDLGDTGTDVESLCLWYEPNGWGAYDALGNYTVYVTSDDALLPNRTPNPAATWRAIYECLNGTGGIYQPQSFMDAIRLPAMQTNVRGVKITGRALAMGLYEILDFCELQIFGPTFPRSNKLTDVKKLANGTQVAIAGKRTTATPGGGLPVAIGYIEEPDRSAGIRINTSAASSVYLGDTVALAGTVRSTPQGEKYIEVTQAANEEGRRPLEAVFMTSRAAATAGAQGMFVKMAGEVIDVGAQYFTICDNSVGTGADKVCIAPMKVVCGLDLLKPSVGDFVRVRGVVSTVANKPVLLMRGNQFEVVSVPTDRHALPFPGKYLYPRDYIILGPFPVKPEGGESIEQLRFDYISDASGGAVTEDTVAPNLGDAVGNWTWQRSLGDGYLLDFNNEFGYNEDVVAYAFYSVWSPEEKIADMAIGSDDGIAVRVNGLQVWENDAYRPVNIGDDLIQYVILNPGWNGILFKVRQGGGGWLLASGLVEQGTYVGAGYGNSGTPIPTLGYALGSK